MIEADQSSEAVSRTGEFLEENPYSQDAQKLLGEILMFREENEKAISAFRKAIGLNRQSPVPYRNLGLALRAVGDESGAQQVFRRGISEVVGDEYSRSLLRSYLLPGET